MVNIEFDAWLARYGDLAHGVALRLGRNGRFEMWRHGEWILTGSYIADAAGAPYNEIALRIVYDEYADNFEYVVVYERLTDHGDRVRVSTYHRDARYEDDVEEFLAQMVCESIEYFPIMTPQEELTEEKKGG